MKIKKLKVLFIILFCSCLTKDSVKKPNNLIGEKKMEAILYDLSIINSIKSSKYIKPNYSDLSTDSYIYKKHDVDSLQLIQSESYYSKIPMIYLKIYNNVEKRLNKTKDSMNNINLSN